MGNRMLKESIRTSKKLGSLDDFTFRLWTYLITYVDDYGRGSADPELLKGFLFVRRKGVTEKNIADALDKLACAGLVGLYDVDDEPFLYFPTWGEHQRIQSRVSKFPDPEADGAILREVTESHRESRKVTVSHGESPLETKPNRNQVEVELETSNAHACESGFEQFWEIYPKKQGIGAARKAWAKTKGVPLDAILNAVERHKRSAQWTKDNGQYIPNPATWLNQERWNDVLDSASVSQGGRDLDADELDAIRRMMGG